MALVVKSNKNLNKIDHKWDQSDPGIGGKGYPKINESMKTKKQLKSKEPKTNKQKRYVLIVLRFSQKSEGSTAGRLLWYYQQL